MRITKICVQENWEQKYKREEFIDCIIEQILTICKFDENFINKNTDDIDESVDKIKNRIKNKDEILIKSDEIRKSLKGKITELEDKNFKIKMNLLEYLGTEL